MNAHHPWMGSPLKPSTPSERLKRVLGQKSLRKSSLLAVVTALSTAMFAMSANCFAQQSPPANQTDPSATSGSAPNELRRQSPAPWRPAFSGINRAATNNGSTATAENSANGSAAPPANPAAPNTQFNLNNAGRNIGPAEQTPANPTVNDWNATPAAGYTKVTQSLDKLPNSAGQVWREYDITPYTSQIKSVADPQKAITEWILRETGTEMWFNSPLGILSADKSRLYVYHTPEIQTVVKSIVDRFTRTRAQTQNLDINLVTVEKPNWRAQSYTMLQPIDVKSPGVEAWMISKENAAILLSQLRQRGDFKQHSSGQITNHDGQTFVLEKTQPVQFIRSLRWVPNQTPNYQPLMTQVDEGYRLSISSLSALDDGSIESVIKCDVDQVEKLTTVKVNVPGINGGAETMSLQIPQLVSWRLHERFRWPNDQVLLLSCGVVATPEPTTGGGFQLPGIGGVLGGNAKRADALLFIEYRGPATGASVPQTAGQTPNLAPLRR